jgi:hypothetical protein
MSDSSQSDDDSGPGTRRIRTAADLQRIQLEKLMKNPVSIFFYIFIIYK